MSMLVNKSMINFITYARVINFFSKCPLDPEPYETNARVINFFSKCRLDPEPYETIRQCLG